MNVRELLRNNINAARAAFAAGEASVGGSFEGACFPGYSQAYVRAARAVLDAGVTREDLNTLARPCVYLQRHAVELHVKELCNAADEIFRRCEAYRTGTKYEAATPIRGHSLMTLISAARLKLAACDNPKWLVPEDLVQLAQELTDFEGTVETTLRYARTAKNESSFPEQKTARARDWQCRLERISEDLTVRDDVFSRSEDTYSMVEQMSVELYALGDEA
jgi:hypothetical protein